MQLTSILPMVGSMNRPTHRLWVRSRRRWRRLMVLGLAHGRVRMRLVARRVSYAALTGR